MPRSLSIGGSIAPRRQLSAVLQRWWPRRLLSVFALVLTILWRFWSQRRRRQHEQQEDEQQEEGPASPLPSELADPTFGVSYSKNWKKDLWMVFVKGLNMPLGNGSAVEHARLLFERPDLTKQLEGLFDVLGNGSPCLKRGDLERVSRGLRGELHEFMHTSQRMPLCEATFQDRQWLTDNFHTLFSDENPFDKDVFVNFLKLIIMRRVVRTMVNVFGGDVLVSGREDPLVIDIVVDLGYKHEPFRIHTVVPPSHLGKTGEHLSTIVEASPGAECPSPCLVKRPFAESSDKVASTTGASEQVFVLVESGEGSTI